jgi:hypothetical protein
MLNFLDDEERSGHKRFLFWSPQQNDNPCNGSSASSNMSPIQRCRDGCRYPLICLWGSGPAWRGNPAGPRGMARPGSGAWRGLLPLPPGGLPKDSAHGISPKPKPCSPSARSRWCEQRWAHRTPRQRWAKKQAAHPRRLHQARANSQSVESVLPTGNELSARVPTRSPEVAQPPSTTVRATTVARMSVFI